MLDSEVWGTWDLRGRPPTAERHEHSKSSRHQRGRHDHSCPQLLWHARFRPDPVRGGPADMGGAMLPKGEEGKHRRPRCPVSSQDLPAMGFDVAPRAGLGARPGSSVTITGARRPTDSLSPGQLTSSAITDGSGLVTISLVIKRSRGPSLSGYGARPGL